MHLTPEDHRRLGLALAGEVRKLLGADASTTRLALPSGFQYPNGIARATDGTLYVGSITSGRVIQRGPGGNWQTLHPGSDGVFAATALRLDERTGLLWGASPDYLGSQGPNARPRRHRIFALDASTGAVRLSVTLPDAGFGNDLVLDGRGGVFVTDSRNPRLLHLASGADQFTTVAEDPRFRPVGGIGLAGLSILRDGRVLLGHFGAGRLFLVDLAASGSGRVTEVALPERLNNPDGMVATPDGRVILVEADLAGGNGRLLMIEDVETGRARISTLADGLNAPVNLTHGTNEVWLTESRIRDRRNDHPDPEEFFVRRLTLPQVKDCANKERLQRPNEALNRRVALDSN